MTHAPIFWANKLPEHKRAEFWTLINLGFGGETAFCRIDTSHYFPGEYPGKGLDAYSSDK